MTDLREKVYEAAISALIENARKTRDKLRSIQGMDTTQFGPPARSIFESDAKAVTDAILALLPQPTDDVKALIVEARQYTRLEQATVVNHDTTHALVCLCDRLATALSKADAEGYARGIEEAAHRLTVLPPTGSLPKNGATREAWLAGHTSALINAQGVIRALKPEQPK